MINNSSLVSQANHFVRFYEINLIILETGKKPLFLLSGGEGEDKDSLRVIQKRKSKKET